MASMTDPSETMYLRIKKVMESYGLQQQAFAKKLGVSPATISSIYTGRTKPSNNLVQAIHREFPEINTNWLLFEEGEMRLSSTTFSASSEQEELVQNVVSHEMQPSSPFPPLGGEMPMFFAEENPQVTPPPQPVQPQPARATAAHRTPNRTAAQPVESVFHTNANAFDKQPRRVKEIRVFYDDGTFEVFAPANK